MINKSVLILFVISLLAGAGCTVVHTVPLAARPGDTILVSVGSPDDMTTANTNMTYTPNGGSPIAIPNSAVRSIFNLYPDKTSSAWLYSIADVIENDSGHGPWTTIIALDLPGGPGDTSGVVLPQGLGSLQVSTTAIYGSPIRSVNGQNISLEILPGTGSPSSFDYLGFGGVRLQGDLSQLETMKKLLFKPAWTGIDTANTYGAVEIKIGIDTTGISEDDLNIIVDDKIGTVQTRNLHSFSRKLSRFEIAVYFISPTGELQYSDVNFSIVSMGLQSQFESGTQNVATDVTINSAIWYDVNGVVDTGGPPITIVNQTGT